MSRALPARSPLADSPTWPEEFRDRYRRLGHWLPETFDGWLRARTSEHAGRVAVIGTDAGRRPVRWTYGDLEDQIELWAGRFGGLGIRAGDRVVVQLPNIVEFVPVVFGLFRIGALPVFALPGHRERELAQFCRIADAAAHVVCGLADGVDFRGLHAVVAARLDGVAPPLLVDVQRPPAAGAAVPAPREPEEVGFLQLSGGTTGISKLIPRTASDYLYSVRESTTICGLTADSRLLVVLPVAHNFPMSSPGILGMLHVGGSIVLAPDPSPRTAFDLIERERVTIASLVPPLAQAWLSTARRRPPRLDSLELLQVGGAKLAPAVADDIGPVLGVGLQQVFGMAEGLVNYTRAGDPDDIVRISQGLPISPDDELRIVDPETGVVVAPGAEGVLQTRGPYTIRGYYRDPAANRVSFTDDGFYVTGDLVRQLPTGHLVVTGRVKDQINRGGEKIAAAEVEDLLLTHPAVRDAVVVGLPDDYLGERTCAFIVPDEAGRAAAEDAAGRGSGLARELGATLRSAGLATFKLPDQYRFLSELPATGVGKNSRRDLRALLTERFTEPPRTTGRPA